MWIRLGVMYCRIWEWRKPFSLFKSLHTRCTFPNSSSPLAFFILTFYRSRMPLTADWPSPWKPLKACKSGQGVGDEPGSPVINWWSSSASMSDDLIARRVLQEQQGCESESGILTINRCYFKHDFSAHRHSARLCSFTEKFILRPSVSSDFTHSITKLKSRLTFALYWLMSVWGVQLMLSCDARRDRGEIWASCYLYHLKLHMLMSPDDSERHETWT